MEMSTSCQSARRHLSPLAVLLIVLIGADAAYIPGNAGADDGIDAPLVFPTLGSQSREIGFLTPLNSDHSELLRLSKGNRSGILPDSNQLNGTEEVSENVTAINEGEMPVNITQSDKGAPPSSEKEAKAVSQPVQKLLTDKPLKEQENTKDLIPKTEKQTQGPNKNDVVENLHDKHWGHDHLSGNRGPLPSMRTPEATVLAAAVFVAVALFGYFGLVCWRRSLERKYGNRELLVNEDEVNDMGDYKSSEIGGRSSMICRT